MSREVTWDGKKYPSIAAAARAEGVANQTMRNWLEIAPKPRPKYPDEITIRGVTYPNADAAAEAFGVNRSWILLARRRGRLHTVGMPKVRRRKS